MNVTQVKQNKNKISKSFDNIQLLTGLKVLYV